MWKKLIIAKDGHGSRSTSGTYQSDWDIINRETNGRWAVDTPDLKIAYVDPRKSDKSLLVYWKE